MAVGTRVPLLFIESVPPDLAPVQHAQGWIFHVPILVVGVGLVTVDERRMGPGVGAAHVHQSVLIPNTRLVPIPDTWSCLHVDASRSRLGRSQASWKACDSSSGCRAGAKRFRCRRPVMQL